MGGGLASLSPFPLHNSVRSLLNFGIKNVNFCCFLGGMFLCDVMSSPLQNHKCNILSRMFADAKITGITEHHKKINNV